MKGVSKFAMGVLALLTVSAGARRALACGACECEEQPLPIVGLIREVPLNLALPLRVLADEGAPRLERVSDGRTVGATVEKDAQAAVWYLKVDQDLDPGVDYRIVRDSGVEAAFTTGTVRDLGVPTLGEVSSKTGGNAGLCDVETGGLLQISGAHDDNSQFAVWLELELTVRGETVRRYTDYHFGVVTLGRSASGCFGTRELPAIESGQAYPGRVRLHDVADHASDWFSFVLMPGAEAPAGCGAPAGVGGSGGTNSQPDQPPSDNAGSPPQQDEHPDAAAARTSKGCGCAVADRRGGSGTEAVILVSALLAFRRRSRR